MSSKLCEIRYSKRRHLSYSVMYILSNSADPVSNYPVTAQNLNCTYALSYQELTPFFAWEKNIMALAEKDLSARVWQTGHACR